MQKFLAGQQWHLKGRVYSSSVPGGFLCVCGARVSHCHALECYVAICQPHYLAVMSPGTCTWMTLASLLSGLIYAAVHTSNTFWLPFCRSNIVQQLFCDITSLLKLPCSDTFSNKVSAAVSSLVISGGCFVFILRSHIYIFSTVLRLPAGADRKKGLLHLCPPHSHGVRMSWVPTAQAFTSTWGHLQFLPPPTILCFLYSTPSSPNSSTLLSTVLEMKK